MCVNDIVVQGAEPLFFLDYYATGKLNVDDAAVVIEGIARACKESGCALIGGETAEMPGLYAKGDFDLAGFSVGAVERGHDLAQDARDDAGRCGDRRRVSSGVHSNGYSLVRRVVADAGLAFDAPAPFDAATKLGEALLAPTRLYVKSALEAIRARRRERLRAYHRRRHHRKSAARAAEGLDAEIDLARVDAIAGVRLAGEIRRHRRARNAAHLQLRTRIDRDRGGGIAPGHVIDAFQECGERAMRIGTLVEGEGEAKVRYSGALKL